MILSGLFPIIWQPYRIILQDLPKLLYSLDRHSCKALNIRSVNQYITEVYQLIFLYLYYNFNWIEMYHYK